MASYVSASKLCLVVLTRLYVEGHVPSAASIEVLSFIGSRLDPETKLVTPKVQKKQDAQKDLSALSLQDFQNVLSEDKFSGPVEKLGSDITLWEVFGSFLLQISDLHTMCHFFSNFDVFSETVPTHTREGTSTKPLAPNSPLGLFIRRFRVEFGNMHFPEVVKLWYSFERYVRPLRDDSEACALRSSTIQALAVHLNLQTLRDPKDEDSRLEFIPSDTLEAQIIAQSMGNESDQTDLTSSHDFERLLEFQIEQMRRKGGYVATGMRSQLKSLLQNAGSSSNLTDYVRFLEAWYKGDYFSCFEYLHRYYDYAMKDSDKKVYQNVLLQMATVQADFGCYNEAMSAMDQAISVARENKDKLCLHYCLSWLHQMRLSSSQQMSKQDEEALLGAEASGLEYLKNIARKDDVPGIQVQSLLTEARYHLAKGHRPLRARELLYEAEHIMIRHMLCSYRAAHSLLLSDIYSRLGLAALSLSYCTMAITASEASLDDVILSHCGSAFHHASAGRYKLAFNSFKAAQEPASRNIRSQQHLAQCLGIVKLKRALHNNDLNLAERLISTLKSTPTDEADLNFTASLLEIDYLNRTRNLTQALTLVEDLFEACSRDSIPDVLKRIRLMTAKAELFAKCNRPQKGFSIAMRAVVAAKRSQNVFALLEAVTALAGVLVGLRQWEAAFQLLESAKGRILETQDLVLSTKCTKLGVETLTIWAGTVRENEKKQELLTTAFTWAEETAAAYVKLEEYVGEQDVLRKMASLARYLGDEARATELEEKALQKEQSIRG